MGRFEILHFIQNDKSGHFAKGSLRTIIDEKIVREFLPQLRRAGAQGIIEYPLNKVIP